MPVESGDNHHTGHAPQKHLQNYAAGAGIEIGIRTVPGIRYGREHKAE